MLLLNIKIKKAVLAIPLLFLSICLTAGIAFSKEANRANFYQSFSRLMESAEKENKYLLDGWNDYIIKVLGYSNAEHLKVIEELTMDYANAINKLDEKYEKDLKQDEINYSSEWLDELANRFGKNFICNNKRSIMLNLMMASSRNEAKKYDQYAKDILSKELILYLAYERYLGVFMQYYNQLSEKDQKKMNAWQKVAEKYLSITNRSHFATVYYGMHMKDKIRDNALKKENKALYMFFNNTKLPYGNGVSNKAERDIDMFIAKFKMQSVKQPEKN